MKKRLLSVFLVIAMLCSLVPAMSFAASAEEAEEMSEDFYFSTPPDVIMPRVSILLSKPSGSDVSKRLGSSKWFPDRD